MNDIDKDDYVKDDNNDDWNTQEPVTVSHIHPAIFIFIEESVDDIRYQEYGRSNPTNPTQAQQNHPILIHLKGTV